MRGARRPLVALAATVLAGALAVSGTAAIAVAFTLPEPAARRAGSAPPSALFPAGAAERAPSTHDSSPPVGPALPAAEPVAIHIPTIGVRSPLHPLGKTAAGTIQVPSGRRYDEAAWYRHSVTPGSRGPAVILGHVDSPSDGPSVFFKLAQLRPGDRVRVTRDDGRIATFRVDGVRTYAKDEFPTRLVFGATPHAALRLITCGGVFDRSTGHYQDNVVVYASLDAPPPPAATARLR